MNVHVVGLQVNRKYKTKIFIHLTDTSSPSVIQRTLYDTLSYNSTTL